MTFAGKYTKLTLLHPKKTVDASWIVEHYDLILEELYFATSTIKDIAKRHKAKKKKKKKKKK